MVEKTILLLPAGKKMSVPRLFKRILQVALTIALTALVVLVMIVGNGLLTGRGSTFQIGVNTWLAFIQRGDIVATIVLTSVVAVSLVYWQRNAERK